MFEKVRGLFTKGLGAVKERLNQFQQPIKWIVIGYMVTVFLFVVSYYGFWVYLAVTGKIQLPDLLAMIRELVGPAMVGFITFIAGCFVDLDGNGIPDHFEKEKDKP
jgi:hypothetical protein